jgi:predicted transcriptional regulator
VVSLAVEADDLMLVVVMSIKPAYADAILRGTKRVELRRRAPRLRPGDHVLVYASAPTQRIVGWFEAGETLAAPPAELWPQVALRSGITRRDFDTYFCRSELAYGIEIVSAARLAPVKLSMKPPQSWCYLRRGKAAHDSLLALWASERFVEAGLPCEPGEQMSAAWSTRQELEVGPQRLEFVGRISELPTNGVLPENDTHADSAAL